MSMFKLNTSDHFKGLFIHILWLLVVSGKCFATEHRDTSEDGDGWFDSNEDIMDSLEYRHSAHFRGHRLGTNSRCYHEREYCGCYDHDHYTPIPNMIYHNRLRKCFPRKRFSDVCKSGDECTASLGPKAKCGKHWTFPSKQVCYYDASISGSDANLARTVTDCIRGYVYVNHTQSCWAISIPLDHHLCNSDAECSLGAWGKHSKCSPMSLKCECFSGNDDTFLVDGVCYLNKTIGDSCHEDTDCNATIKGGVYCKNATDLLAASCQCRDTHLWYSPMHKCLRRSTGIHDQCIVSYQCAEAGLGRYSRCNPETNQCECYGGAHVDILYHNVMKKCFPKRKFNETCKDSAECRVSLGPKVKCGRTEEHPDEMVCHYDESDIPSPRKDDGGEISSQINYPNDGSEPRYSMAEIVMVTLAIVILAAIIFFLASRCNRTLDREKKPKTKKSPAAESLLLRGVKTIKIYSPEEITSQSMVGEGNFGQVFQGTLDGRTVAVKKIKNDFHLDTIREMETVAKFSHPNILSLVGIVKNSALETIWLLFEFMELGDLAKVLKDDRFRPSQSLSNNYVILDIYADSSNSQQLQLTSDTLLSISLQIAKGMLYLSSRHYVHRDLAARNCLVGATGYVKIADFGLSRDVYASHYYRGKTDTPLPIRWMAPESVTRLYFTVESDVWAYGILLWEIYSWGMLPYIWLTTKEVMDQINDVVLPPPHDCPVYIMELMSGCWKREPKSRLTFQQICDTLTAYQPNSSGSSKWNESEYEVPISVHRPEYLHYVEVE